MFAVLDCAIHWQCRCSLIPLIFEGQFICLLRWEFNGYWAICHCFSRASVVLPTFHAWLIGRALEGGLERLEGHTRRGSAYRRPLIQRGDGWHRSKISCITSQQTPMRISAGQKKDCVTVVLPFFCIKPSSLELINQLTCLKNLTRQKLLLSGTCRILKSFVGYIL